MATFIPYLCHMYRLIKPIFFKFDPEKVHHFVVKGLKWFNNYFPFGKNILRLSFGVNNKNLAKEVFGINFKNPVGLAAGFDKNAEYVAAMSNLGFGFIEVGTVTPLPQPGNDKPRMFRLPKDQALINRMGFNNKGLAVVAANLKLLKNKHPEIVVGGNIGKNKITPNQDAVKDYIKCFDGLYNVVDYFVVNVSSPNTPGLRALQEKEPLKNILNTLQKRNLKNAITRPILLKIAPDLTIEQLNDIIEIVAETGIAGIIATNTTITRDNLISSTAATQQAGGLSGLPVKNRATEVIRYLAQKSDNAFPIIGVGGIHSAQDAKEKIEAGASLVQLYTGFIYQGPGLIKRICKALG